MVLFLGMVADPPGWSLWGELSWGVGIPYLSLVQACSISECWTG